MNKIICPHCKTAFKVDESGYAEILKQVRDEDFEHQLHERLELAEQDKSNAVELATIKTKSELQKELDTLQAELHTALNDKKTAVELTEAKLVNQAQKNIAQKDAKIQAMESKLNSSEVKQRHAGLM